MEWKDITIGTYQDICKEYSEDYADETDRAVGLLSCITGKPIYHYTNEIKVDELIKKFRQIDFIKNDIPKVRLKSKQRVSGRTFVFDLNINNAGKYIGFSKLVEKADKINDNLHLIMATLCYEVNMFGFKKESDFKERAEFLQKNMSIVYAKSLSAFFLSNYQRLTTATKDYLEQEKERMKKQTEKIIDLASSSIGGGTSH